MEITTTSNVFLNDWINQISSTKVDFIPDSVLVESLKYIEENGIPNLKNEAYRNVPIESILKRYFRTIEYNLSSEVNTPTSTFPLHIILSPNYTLTYGYHEGIFVVSSLNDVPKRYLEFIGQTQMHQKDFFAALNTAYNHRFTVVHIQKSIDEPLHILHDLEPYLNFSQHRLLILIDDNVSVKFIETLYSGNIQHPYLYNTLTEIYVGENTSVEWYSVQKNVSNSVYSIQNTAFALQKSASLKHYQISLEGALWRNNLNFHIQDKEVNCELKGLSIGKGQNIISQNTAICHHSGYSHSHQLYKNIAEDKSTVLFNGFILVDKNAQKTDAYQNSKNILLNDNATIFARPQLEIYADDVKCSHGSSTGALNEDALFYLKARGIEESEAQKLLLQAFYSDIIESIEEKNIKDYIESLIQI
ncbi:MAG: Fe-S cluster assembly protein SufD [Bacteroidia bacterium]|nr:MAG: Fe-S cluster assembly protein SufD [Bacteroidia bacterium]